jgi:serine/threonine-protein kinase
MSALDELPAGAPRPGSIFADRYRIDGVLGVGGMGYVLAATSLDRNERVAIKLLLPNLVTHADTVERFKREGRAAVKIRSEHVAKILDVAELPDRTPYLVIEYLDGSDLAALLERRGRLSHQEAVDHVLQACEAVAEAHAMRTIHRDLKPSNLFLTKTARGEQIVKVLDFGISKMSVENGGLAMTKTSNMMGSPLYMSPEQLKNAREVDARTDIWAIGVILYELISGKPPFHAESFAELSALVLSGASPWLADAVPEVPAGLADVVSLCLTKDLERRFLNLADFADAIAPFGGPGAAASAARIVATLGMPASRAVRGQRAKPAFTGNVTHVMPDAPSNPRRESSPSLPLIALGGTAPATTSNQQQTLSGAGTSKLFMGFLALGLLGFGLAGFAYVRRHVPQVAGHGPSATTAPVAPPVLTVASPLPPDSASAPMPSAATAPVVASASASVATGAAHTPPLRGVPKPPKPTGAATAPTTTATAAKPPAGIATSSKD